MIRDILYLIVYFITETVLYSLAYRTALSRGITNKAVKWIVYIIVVLIAGSIVYSSKKRTPAGYAPAGVLKPNLYLKEEEKILCL